MEILQVKVIYTCFVDLGKVYDRFCQETFWWVSQDYGVNSQLLLVVIERLHSSSKVCLSVPRGSGRNHSL